MITAAGSKPTTLEIVTLVIAVLGLVLAAVTFGWQIVSWLYEGARVKVKHGLAFLTSGPNISDQMLYVTAMNVGRAPVEITGWGIDIGDGKTMFVEQPLGPSTPLPATIDGAHHASWYMELAEYKRGLAKAQPTKPARPYVSLGTDKRVYGKPITLRNP